MVRHQKKWGVPLKDAVASEAEEMKIWEIIRSFPQRPIAFHGTSVANAERIAQEGLTEGNSGYFIFDPRDFNEENIKESLVALKNHWNMLYEWGKKDLYL